MGAAARRVARDLDPVDLEAAVNAGVTRYATAGDDPLAVAADVAHAAAAMAELDRSAAVGGPADYALYGTLLPVLAGSPSAGASVLAAVLADAFQLAGAHTLLIDAADPARSGLAAAAAEDGPWVRQLHPLVAVRYSWRHSAVLARLEGRVVAPGMVPPPRPDIWLPPLQPQVPPHVTVVDIGHDGWRATANPLAGAGGWLRSGIPAPSPILVVEPTRPSLRHAEQVLARLDPWIAANLAVFPYQLVVMGAKRWPGGVVGVAGHRLEPLINEALFIPFDAEVNLAGVTADLMPDKLIDAVNPVLADCEFLPATRRSTRQRGHP